MSVRCIANVAVSAAFVIGAVLIFGNVKDYDPCEDSAGAYQLSQQIVSARLSNPESAVYPSIGTVGISVTKLDGCKFEINSFVSWPSSKVRSAFKVELTRVIDDRWTASAVEIHAAAGF